MSGTERAPYGGSVMHTMSRVSPLSGETRTHECRYRAVLDQMSDVAILVDGDGFLRYVNPACERLLGVRPGGREGNLFAMTMAEDLNRLRSAVLDAVRLGTTTTIEHRQRLPQGGAMLLETTVQHFVELDSRPLALLVGRDVADRRAHHERRLEAHTLETAAQVSAAIARDFGDLLQTLGRHIDVVAMTAPPPAQAEARAMRHTLDRAWVLVDQVQSFGGSDDLRHPQGADVHDTVADAANHLERLAGPGAEIIHLLGATASRVNMSKTALEQLLVVLVMRARESMATGRLTITTRDASEMPSMPDTEPMAPGTAVLIEVTDSGPALTSSQFARVETGANASDMELELRRVFALVRRAGGRVLVDANPEAGTTVRVLLPVEGGDRG